MEQAKTPLSRPTASPVSRPVMDVSRPAAVGASPETQQAPVQSPDAVHKPPPEDSSEPNAQSHTDLPKADVQPAPRSQAITQRPVHHVPIGAIALIIMGMLILSGLAVLVYFNS